MIVHANAATCMPGHALELFVPALMLLRACAVHARCAHARRWHRMGDKCIPAAQNQLLTGILASIMQSSCLFRRNTADSAACAHRYTAAQPCRPAPRMPAHSQNLLNFSKSKTERSGTLERSLTFLPTTPRQTKFGKGSCWADSHAQRADARFG